MTVYQHKKGVICNNAIEALLHDPLFKTRVEVNQKGKGSYRRREKHAKKAVERPEVSSQSAYLPLAFCLRGLKTCASSFLRINPAADNKKPVSRQGREVIRLRRSLLPGGY